MCVFSGVPGVQEKGLLPVDGMTFPIPRDELPGEVLFGWKKLSLSTWDEKRGSINLRSQVYGNFTWEPGQPRVTPRFSKTVGVYMYSTNLPFSSTANRSPFLGARAIAYMAGWGRAWNFTTDDDSSNRDGAVVEAAHPLELYIEEGFLDPGFRRRWESVGVDVYPLSELARSPVKPWETAAGAR